MGSTDRLVQTEQVSTGYFATHAGGNIHVSVVVTDAYKIVVLSSNEFCLYASGDGQNVLCGG
jgi:hypothetical protein